MTDTASVPAARRPISPAGKVFAVAAFLEAFTWAGLLVGMFLKYVTETTELGVQIFGALHGGMFLIYCAVTLGTALALRWKWWVAGLALAASVPPLTTILVEVWLRRRGSLSAPARAEELVGA